MPKIVMQEKRLDSMDKRFDKMEHQIEKVEGNQSKQVRALIGILFTAVAVIVPTKVLASSEAIVQNVDSDRIRRNLTEEQKIREEHEKMCKTWALKLVTQYFYNNIENERERNLWSARCADTYNPYYENDSIPELVPPRPPDLNIY